MFMESTNVYVFFFSLNIWVYLSDILAVVRAIIVHVLCRRMLILIDVFFSSPRYLFSWARISWNR